MPIGNLRCVLAHHVHIQRYAASVADSFPYTVASSALIEFLTKHRTMGVPDKVDQAYLKKVGYGSSNHRSFIPIMKFVDLLDGNGVPTDRYRKGLRGGDAGRRLIAEGIKQGYSSLFATYPDANIQPTSTIATFVGAHSDLGDRALSAAVATFQKLCTLATFDEGSDGASGIDTGEEDDVVGTRANGGRAARAVTAGGSTVNINVNIALSVDATSDAGVYDAFFAAMAKHIMNLADGDSPQKPA